MDLVTPGIGLIFWTSLIFLLLIFLLGKFAWKPILSAVKEREQAIEDAVKLAETTREEMKKLSVDNEKLLQEARIERDKILKEAFEIAGKIRSEAGEKANHEYSKIVDSAKLAIENEKKEALRQINKLVTDLSVEIAERIVKKELSNDKAQQELIDASLSKINLN